MTLTLAANEPEVVVEYINLRDQESANTAIRILNTANEQVATFRAYVGALKTDLPPQWQILPHVAKPIDSKRAD